METSEQILNPAGRLQAFLLFTRERSNSPTNEAWGDYFDATPFTHEFFGALSAVGRLPGEVEEAINRLPQEAFAYRPKEKMLRSLPAIKEALSYGGANLGAGTQSFNAQLSEQHLHDLDTCVDALGALSSRAQQLSGAEVADTLARAGQLIDDLANILDGDTSLSGDLKETLIDMVSRLRRAISLSRLAGPEVVGQERDRVIGLISTHPEMQTELKQKPHVGSRVLTILTTLNVILSSFNGTALALGSVQPWINELGGASDHQIASTPAPKELPVKAEPSPEPTS